MGKKPKPETFATPERLRESTKRWYLEVLDTFVLDEHHVRLLASAAACWDTAEKAAEVIAEMGLTYDDRFGAPHARPEIAIERDCRSSFARFIRELGLDVPNPEGK